MKSSTSAILTFSLFGALVSAQGRNGGGHGGPDGPGGPGKDSKFTQPSAATIASADKVCDTAKTGYRSYPPGSKSCAPSVALCQSTSSEYFDESSKTCVATCPTTTTLDATAFICRLKAPSGGVSRMTKSDQACTTATYEFNPRTNACGPTIATCKASVGTATPLPYWDDTTNSCVATCPTNYTADDANSTCDIVPTTCTSHTGVEVQHNQCVCSTKGQFIDLSYNCVTCTSTQAFIDYACVTCPTNAPPSQHGPGKGTTCECTDHSLKYNKSTKTCA